MTDAQSQAPETRGGFIHYRGVAFTEHALDAMLRRHANLNEIVDLVKNPDQTYGDISNPDRRVCQKHDLAAVVSRRASGDPVVVTVLLRREEAWSDGDGRPSGKRLSRRQRSRIEAARRNVRVIGIGSHR